MHNYRNHATAATQPNRSVKLLLVGVTTQNENQKIGKKYIDFQKSVFYLLKSKNGIFACEKMHVSFCHDSISSGGTTFSHLNTLARLPEAR